MNQITAMILAGGLGTRLRPAVSDRPKVIAEVNNRPFLSFLLDQLSGAGIRNAVFCTGYLGEQIEQTFGQVYRDVHLNYSREASPLGTGGALKLAHATVKSDLILVLNGDSFIDVDLREFVAFHRTQRPAASLVLAHVADTRRFGRVQLKPDGWVSSFEEKGSHVGPGMINAGVYLLESKVLESIPSGRAVSLEREVLPSLTNNQLSGFPCQGKFIDIGTPETYAAAETFFSESRNAAIGG